jgi:hypothetical protein
MDEAIAAFKRELPNWYWSITECWVSIHGECGSDWTPGYQDHPDFGVKPVELELGKPSGSWGGTGGDPTPVQFLMMLLEKAKAARAACYTARNDSAGPR